MNKECTYSLRAYITEEIVKQTALRRELHDLMENDPNCPRINEVRKLMMKNRLGRSGLRSLNNLLRGRAINR